MEDTEKEGIHHVSPVTKREYLEGIRPRYQQAGKKGKGLILDEFCQVYGYDLKHAIRLLQRSSEPKRKRFVRGKVYGLEVEFVVKDIWPAADRREGVASLGSDHRPVDKTDPGQTDGKGLVRDQAKDPLPQPDSDCEPLGVGWTEMWLE